MPISSPAVFTVITSLEALVRYPVPLIRLIKPIAIFHLAMLVFKAPGII